MKHCCAARGTPRYAYWIVTFRPVEMVPTNSLQLSEQWAKWTCLENQPAILSLLKFQHRAFLEHLGFWEPTSQDGDDYSDACVQLLEAVLLRTASTDRTAAHSTISLENDLFTRMPWLTILFCSDRLCSDRLGVCAWVHGQLVEGAVRCLRHRPRSLELACSWTAWTRPCLWSTTQQAPVSISW